MISLGGENLLGKCVIFETGFRSACCSGSLPDTPAAGRVSITYSAKVSFETLIWTFEFHAVPDCIALIYGGALMKTHDLHLKHLAKCVQHAQQC